MKAKHRRVLEGIKTLLIVILGCSAVFLAAQTLFPTQGEGLLSKLPTVETPAGQESSGLYDQLLRPAAFAVTWEEGRYGQLYHQEDPEGYTTLFTPLAEALTLAGAPVSTTSAAWREALEQPGFYCEYLGTIPLDALSRWLSGSGNENLSGFAAQRMCVNADRVYFTDGDGTIVYAAALSSPIHDALRQLFEQFTPNGARFAAQSGEDTPLRADALELDTTPILPALTGECPIAATASGDGETGAYTPNDALFSILQQLSFHPQTNPLYAIGNGWAITDSGETLRISSTGQISYRRSDYSTLRYNLEGDGLEFTKNLTQATLAPLAGSGSLYLAGVEEVGTATVITYAFSFRGARIDLGDNLWCASYTIEQGTLSGFTLWPRKYSVLEGGDVALLPQTQAIAALEDGTENAALEVVYADTLTGEAIKPFWAVKEG